MNNEDLILQKLEELATDIKEVRTDVKEVNEKLAKQEVNHTELRGEVRTRIAELSGEVRSVRQRFDMYLDTRKELKLDRHNLWIYGGIAFSIAISVANFIYTHFK